MLPGNCKSAESETSNIVSICLCKNSVAESKKAATFKRVLDSFYVYIQGGPKKTGQFLRVDNFATVSDRKAYYMSKFCKFCLEKSVKVAYQCV